MGNLGSNKDIQPDKKRVHDCSGLIIFIVFLHNLTIVTDFRTQSCYKTVMGTGALLMEQPGSTGAAVKVQRACVHAVYRDSVMTQSIIATVMRQALMKKEW